MGITARLASRFSAALGALAIVFAVATPAAAETPVDVQRMLIEETAGSTVPPALALAVARVESNFEPRAESVTGAKGVMQLMPKTARDVFGVSEDKLWNARLNIRLGVTFLAQLYEQYGHRWDLALSHYNGGTLEGGSGPYAIPHDFTRQYVADVLRWQKVYAAEVFERPTLHAGDPRFAPVASTADDRPWRLAAAGESRVSRAHPMGASNRPWRRNAGFDPLEYDDWAHAQQDRIAARRDAYAEPAP